MIKADIEVRNKGRCRIAICGHANYSEYGKDIVCAAISGLVLALEESERKSRYKFLKSESRDGTAEFEAYDTDGAVFGMFMCAACGLAAVAREYPKNVKIKKFFKVP